MDRPGGFQRAPVRVRLGAQQTVLFQLMTPLSLFAVGYHEENRLTKEICRIINTF